MSHAGYRERYGIPGDEIKNLRSRWDRIRDDCLWGGFDEFVFWASESGYQKGLWLKYHDEAKPAGPNNCYWHDAGKGAELEEKRRKAAERNAAESPFCTGCTMNTTACEQGCHVWREKWVENWNRNICRKPKEPEAPQGKQYFRYEHPDLVREGIVCEDA